MIIPRRQVPTNAWKPSAIGERDPGLGNLSRMPSLVLALALVGCLVLRSTGRAQTASCGTCHPDRFHQWAASPHAHTQTDVANELSQSDVGLSPAAILQAEDCLACHSPTSVLANGTMTEPQTLSYFFTTSAGLVTAGTAATNTAAWPHVECAACHSVPTNHVTAPSQGPPPTLALFDAQTAGHRAVTGASQLCGQCHGSLHFADTDHRLYDAWAASKHANTQTDVANELSQARAGQSPEDVIYGTGGENCIACHAPTAVLAARGDEADALNYFFTTTAGVFTTNTVAAHGSEWPNVACNACHDPHNPTSPAYFNSDTLEYEVMTNSAQLCGQCHGNLRFPDTDHLSYNLLQGTGGVGVPDQQLMAEVTCVDCHMHRSDVDGSNSSMAEGHSWAVALPEADGSLTVSCLKCHTDAQPQDALAVITGWQADFQALDATVTANVARAAQVLQGVQDPALQAALAEARHNLAYAESDESGGFHNHTYLMALLQDANAKALSIPILGVRLDGAELIVSWIGTGTLQSATSPAGPWQVVTSGAGPAQVPLGSQGPARYFRLQR
ncbi:MAG: ammonia-forming cytochrome c nitrite reductase subunit c552 [Verrucomicrobia bacterium]|nr:ammonia-forming cytochrome c nitrite reductase subunit c552 [Verrucomicrobiota bacterium]